MNKYTAYGGKIDECIQSQLDIIVNNLLDNIPDVKSIILSGGFGRGEGSVIINDGKVEPLKDYDIPVFVDKMPTKEKIDYIYNSIYTELKMENPENKKFRFSDFVIDLQFKKMSDLELLPDIATYDLKKASYVLYGEDIRNLIPWEIEDIPLSSGLRFLFEKMTGLIAHFSIEYLDNDIEQHKKNLIIYECYKTYIEISTVLCLLMGCYEPSYKARSQLFKENFKTKIPELCEILPELPELVEKATNFKLMPNFENINENTVHLWDQTRIILVTVLKYYLKQYLKIEINKIEEFDDVAVKKSVGAVYHRAFVKSLAYNKLQLKNEFIISILDRTSQMYLNYIFVRKIKDHYDKFYIYPLFSRQSPIINIYLTSAHVLFSIETDGKIKETYFELARKNLNRLVPLPDKLSWNDLRDSYMLAYKLYNQ